MNFNEPTTVEEAAELFSRYGNVGYVDDLLRVAPTPEQLLEAARVCEGRSVPSSVVQAAVKLIAEKFGVEEMTSAI